MTVMQSLKKFFIDTPIATFNRNYVWFSIWLGSNFTIVYTLFYHLYARRIVRVEKDGRVGMPQFAMRIVDGCNLRCEYCTAHSPYVHGLLPADELITSFKEWRKKIHPRVFILHGGEPLLHPELERLVRESANIWNDSKLSLITNGLLLERLKPEVLQAIKETGYEVTISEHTFDPEHRKTLDAGYARLQEAKILFVSSPSRVAWVAVHDYDEEGKVVPYRSDPKKAWNQCLFRHCVVVDENQLYRCAYLRSVVRALRKGGLDTDTWKAALTYTPLTLAATPEEIVEHLRSPAMPACSVCPSRRKIVPARQLPPKKKETIAETVG
ncbi:MAG: radical SAM protein [Planctomycetaceae bacterium]|jgi:sulfatase maturation enzyme AslB (radical SAM superfamily)|nr:radical SAM protein [Planctomycetaceae bacterium]